MSNAAILWPILGDGTTYDLRATINGVTATVSFSLTYLREFWMSGDGQTNAATESGGIGRADLVLVLQTALRTHAQGGSVTCSLSSTGHVVVANAQAFALLWGDALTTADPTLFGFIAAATASATSTTSPNVAKGLWLPGRPLTVNSRDRRPIVGGLREALSGKSRVSNLGAGTSQKERALSIKGITKGLALAEYAASDAPFGAWESAWDLAIAIGRPFRVYADASAISTIAYSIYRVREGKEPLTQSANPTRWDLSLSLVHELTR